MSYFHSHVIHVVFAGTINDPCITIVPLHCLLVLTCDYVFFFLPQANVNFTLAVVDLEYRDPHCFFFFFYTHVIIVQNSSYSYLAMRCATFSSFAMLDIIFISQVQVDGPAKAPPIV